jgi:hypothetical protein
MLRALLLLSGCALCAAASPKRGYVADDCRGEKCNGNVLTNAAWFYAYNPASPYSLNPPDGSFVPMHWCESGQDAPLPAGTNATFLLGYNEPNLKGQCGLAPADAAKAWAVYLKRWGGGATQFVSPATAGNGIPWLDGFIGNCSALYGAAGCQLSYIAVHDYSCNATNLLTYLKSVSDVRLQASAMRRPSFCARFFLTPPTPNAALRYEGLAHGVFVW